MYTNSPKLFLVFFCYFNMFFYRNDLDTEAEKRGTYLSMMYNIVTSNCQWFFFIISMYTHGNEMQNEWGWFISSSFSSSSFVSFG
jgi:hypothetical protein